MTVYRSARTHGPYPQGGGDADPDPSEQKRAGAWCFLPARLRPGVS